MILPLLLLAAACSDSGLELGGSGERIVTDTQTTTANATPGAMEEALGNGESEATPEFNLPALDQEPVANKVVVSNKPKRESTYHFEGTDITDAQLSEFYIEMDASIDGKAVGTMTFVFWPEKAPITVRNYLRYCDEGFYDGKIYHRILRDFMIQGGSSSNTAAGQGPNGQIKGEFSNDPKWAHRYGVLSMARGGPPDSGSSQYFVITDSENPSVHALNGKYASFGIMIHGVKTLEAIAEVKTKANPRGEPSQPLQRVVVDKVRVIRGTPSVEAEKIERPPFDLHGEPERVKIQHILISFKGTGTTATRTKEEAEKLAKEILEQAKNGADFGALVRSNTDDPGGVTSTPPGSYSLLNTRQGTPELTEAQAAEKAELEKVIEALQTDLLAQVNAKTKTLDDAKAEFFSSEALQKMSVYSWSPREGMMKGFGDTAFSLQVGETGICNFDKSASAYGWHIIKRYK